MIKIDNFAPLLDKYDTFFCDVWGTIWDGEEVYSPIAETFLTLKAKGKRIALLSNTPHLNPHLELKLAGKLKKGIHYDQVITSGDFFAAAVKALWLEKTLQRPDYRCFVFGIGKSEVLETIQPHRTDDIEQADIVYTGALTNPYMPVAENFQTQEFLHLILAKHLPMICTNPDQCSLRKDVKKYVPGAVAAFYEQMGGQVYYFGKPYAGIFDFACKTMGADKARTIMVGDGLATDIAGANACGIDSVLLTKTGLLSVENDHQVNQIILNSPAKPTYVAKQIDLKSYDKKSHDKN